MNILYTIENSIYVNITNTWEYTNEITSFRLTMWT